VPEETVHRRGSTLVRRLRLAPGESTPWHRDPYHRLTVVLAGDALALEYRDGGASERFELSPGQADWDEPIDRIHRGVNVGRLLYEEVTVFFLDRPNAVAQPGDGSSQGRAVAVVEYQPCWPDEFTRIARRIRDTGGAAALRIDHIGSTAVAGLAAKDVIDVQVTVASLDEADRLTAPLRAAGFRHGTRFEHDAFHGRADTDAELRKLFMREPESERRVHVHIRERGRFNQRYALLFRDYLRASDDARRGYELLKRRAAEAYPDSIDGYLSLKEPVLHVIYAGASQWAERVGWRPDAGYV
jgi:GrpB-like predicted nucleotidyltransferase (UPF0157 family)/quercetin dioxygenase-like cupin family protein